MNLTKRSAAALALALAGIAGLVAFAAPAQAAFPAHPSTHSVRVADPDDEPEDVEYDENGQPDLGED